MEYDETSVERNISKKMVRSTVFERKLPDLTARRYRMRFPLVYLPRNRITQSQVLYLIGKGSTLVSVV